MHRPALSCRRRNQRIATGGPGARRQGLSSRLLFVPLALCSAVAAALPTGGQVSTGTGQIGQSGSQLTISQQSQDLAINWQGFSIGSNESVVFNQPGSSAIVLNRVLGQDPSQILGSLRANGQVFILNPNGVLFGSGAQVSVGGLVASTLGLGNADFLAGNYSLGGSSTAAVSNAGTINAADGGYIALLGANVSNSGTLVANLGNVSLAAGQQVTLQLANGSLLGLTVDKGSVAALAENHGLVQANGGQALLTAKAADQLAQAVVNNDGLVEAQTVDNRGGTIRLLGDMNNGTVNLAGTLDASAPGGGNGGFVETSAAQVHVADGTRVTTLAANGQAGNWLIDPQDYTVAASGGDISGATLGSNLGSGNVTLQSSSGATAGSGSININDAVNWSANTLTLTAADNVNINAVMTASGTAGLALNPATANGADSAVSGGTVNVGLGVGGFYGRVNFAGTGNSLSINGTSYTIITSLGVAGDTSTTTLQGIKNGTTGHYALGGNIDASSTSGWNSSSGFAPIINFTGVLDGLGNTVSGLTVNTPSGNDAGLIGSIGAGGVVRNIGVVGGSITGSNWVGGLVGFSNGTLANSYATDTVTGKDYVGGLVGDSYNGTVSGSYASGSVNGAGTGPGFIGGLAGVVNNVLTRSYATGVVTGGSGSSFVGGLVGDVISSGIVSASWSSGNVVGANSVGGLAGYNNGSISNSYATGAATATTTNAGGLVGGLLSSASITDSYSTGAVSGSNSGGLLAYGPGTVTNSYWDKTTSGMTTSAAGTGLTTTQLEAALPTGFSSATWGNAGNQSTPYLLSNAGPVFITNDSSNTLYRIILNAYQLQAMSANLAGHYALGNNIDASATAGWNGGAGFVPVGSGANYFTGVFDGLGFAVDNLAVNLPASDYVGLFGASSGTLRNVGLAGGSVSGRYYTGGLAGFTSGTISKSYSSAAVTGTIYVGGLAGVNTGTVNGSNASGPVTVVSGPAFSTGIAGGLVGSNGGTISNSYSTGPVTAGSGAIYLGGLTGYNGGTLSNAYYDLDQVSINGAYGVVTSGGIYDSQYQAWKTGNYAALSIGNYLALNGSGFYTLGSVQNLKDMLAFTENASVYKFQLTANLDLGSLPGWYIPYFGATTFDGAGHTISNLSVNQNYNGVVGFIGSLAAGSTLTNLDVVGETVSGYWDVGGLVGWNHGTVSNSYAAGSITGNAYAGGLVGANDGTLSGSYYAGQVVAIDHMGGLVGSNSGSINNSYSSGAVGSSGANYVGGLAGINSGTISNSYSVGTVLGTGVVGGLVASNTGTVTSSYWDTQTSGQSSSAGGTGKTTAQMMTPSTFSGWSLATSGGSSSVWRIYAGNTMPLLRSFLAPLTVTLSGATVTYNAANQDAAVVAGYSVASPNLSAILWSSPAINAGTYTVSGSQLYSTQQGYDISYGAAATLVINPALLTLNAVTDTKVYDGGTGAAGTTVGVSGLQGSDSVTGLTESFLSKNVLGTNGSTLAVNAGYSVNDGNGGANYTVVANTASGTITPATLTLNAVTDTKVYDGGTGAAGTTVGISGLQGSDSVSGLTESFLSKNVLGANGSTLAVDAGYSVNDGNGGANYTVVANTASGTITPATLTLNAVTDTKVYDGGTGAAGTTVGVSGLQGSDSVSGLTESFLSKNVLGANGSTLAVDAGYSVNDGNGGANYMVVANTASGTITPATLTLNAVTDTKVYDGGTGAAGTTVGVSGLQGSDSVTGLTESFLSKNVLGTNGSTLAVNAGYSVNDGNGGANYTVVTHAAAGTITPGSLTITANNANRQAGVSNPAFSATYSGLAAGDSPASLGGVLQFSTNATIYSNVGTYAITPFGATSDNYAITFVNGVLTITRMNPEVQAALVTANGYANGHNVVPAGSRRSGTGNSVDDAQDDDRKARLSDTGNILFQVEETGIRKPAGAY